MLRQERILVCVSQYPNISVKGNIKTNLDGLM